MSDSNLRGLYKHPLDERIDLLSKSGFLNAENAALLRSGQPLLPPDHADRMIENVIGVFGLPLGVAVNFRVNDQDYLVPMVVEEPSIVAAVSSAARHARRGGGFIAELEESSLIGQIQITRVTDVASAIAALEAAKPELLDQANSVHPNLTRRGGGVRDIEIHHDETAAPAELVLHLIVDTCDAMGANLVNTLCEALAPQIAEIAAGEAGLKILSNYADRAVVCATCRIPLMTLNTDAKQAQSLRDRIVAANLFARRDRYRAATHNKGIMNGIDALAIATGNDWRAIEAGAHAYAARDGQYRALTEWRADADGDLQGMLKIPLKPGIVGGSLEVNPGARLGLAICGVDSADALAMLMGATGLAQNFAALKALVSTGIQKGHMALHARSVAKTAGVPDHQYAEVVAQLVKSGDVKVWKAQEISRVLSQKENARRLSIGAGSATGTACGKVILLGEHAVVHGRSALAVPIPDAVHASVSAGDGTNHLHAPEWGIQQTWRHGDAEIGGAAAIIDRIATRSGIDSTPLNIEIDSAIPIGAGLGSSAAFAVAVLRALDQFAGLGLSDDDVNAIAFECESITHGTPSGIDNSVATFGRPVLFRKGPEGTMRILEIARDIPMLLASCTTRGRTKEMVENVSRRYAATPAAYDTIFDQINDLAESGATALADGDFEALGAMMNMCHGLLNAIEVSTPELETMVHLARSAGASGAKLTGAGGGGSIVVLCPDTIAPVSRTLRGAGYQTITLSGQQ